MLVVDRPLPRAGVAIQLVCYADCLGVLLVLVSLLIGAGVE